jgi:hypothetical protein
MSQYIRLISYITLMHCIKIYLVHAIIRIIMDLSSNFSKIHYIIK